MTNQDLIPGTGFRRPRLASRVDASRPVGACRWWGFWWGAGSCRTKSLLGNRLRGPLSDLKSEGRKSVWVRVPPSPPPASRRKVQQESEVRSARDPSRASSGACRSTRLEAPFRPLTGGATGGATTTNETGPSPHLPAWSIGREGRASQDVRACVSTSETKRRSTGPRTHGTC